MTETHQKLTVKELLNGSYHIPLYQRNFAWTYDEIKQLIQDVMDSMKEEKDRYYIGTLVTDTQSNIIDGQQRSTALTLIALALQNEFEQTIINKLPIDFPARQVSNDTLSALLLNEVSEEIELNEISRGYKNACQVLNELVGLDEVDAFTNYLLNQVVIFQAILPENLDLNLYFERFNSRGEQLEAHEVIKAQMMAKLSEDEAQKFAKIWDACSDFDRPVVTAFKMRNKRKENHQERENIFGWHFQNYKLNNPILNIEVVDISKQSIVDRLKSSQEFSKDESYQTSSAGNYNTIIDFNTLLLYCLGLKERQNQEEVSLDDKKLLKLYEAIPITGEMTSEWILDFSVLLLQMRHIFDNFIVRNANEDTSSRTKDAWFLQKGTYYEYQRNNKKGTDFFVEERFTNNTFTQEWNKKILMLQSMFAVTFTSNRASRWLYEIMGFLYQQIDELHEDSFAEKFYDKLEQMAIRYAKSRIFSDDNFKIKTYQEDVPVYAFNFIDYVLWKNRGEFKDKFYDSENFRFTYRRSIEHWFPQNPSEQLEKERLDDSYLHSIGNLALITDSQNSKFSNLSPKSKANEWKGIFDRQSLKLQWMAKETTEGEWNQAKIEELESIIQEEVFNFMNSK
ncbi:DUF262 domain-containing protein [Streptococcus loxodontisalivarius]|uniref:Uncharacterized protein with ParB-like and HNH nuclease domain n=1 Tax=Streptococcus loxodontisalivarius TaxID=1349415 RepID=A0ABS2PTX1_9STRE|nr:DUF262 domain-containing protein [Streptococcus loxodontisalivarius]MBM7642802.1 uncharacterized protein with ParB-like and HNH nuclease domain [Streptococcus loxodontisalivarius]